MRNPTLVPTWDFVMLCGLLAKDSMANRAKRATAVIVKNAFIYFFIVNERPKSTEDPEQNLIRSNQGLFQRSRSVAFFGYVDPLATTSQFSTAPSVTLKSG